MKFFKSLTILVMVIFLATPVFAKDVSLTWDASPSADVSGYKIYSNSTIELPFQTVVDVGDVLNYTAFDIPDGNGIYFAATAYDTAGYESSFSNVVYSRSFVPPSPPLYLGGSNIINGITLNLQ